MPISTILCMIVCIILNVGGFIWGIAKIISIQRKQKQN